MPPFAIDVTDVWDGKMAAINAYESQLRNHRGKDGQSWLDRIEVLCRYFGQRVNCKYAEPFFCSEPLGSNQLPLIAELSRCVELISDEKATALLSRPPGAPDPGAQFGPTLGAGPPGLAYAECAVPSQSR